MSITGNYGGVDVPSIVLDIGSNTLRAGYGGEDQPRIISNTSMATKLNSDTLDEDELNNKTYLGGLNETLNYNSEYEVCNPFLEGEIVDWSCYESLLSHCFDNQLKLNSFDQPLLIADYSWSSLKERQTITELMFEKFQVPAFYLARQAVLNAFSSGRTTGLVVDIGSSMSSVTPVYDGYVLKKNQFKQPLGGDNVSDFILSNFNNVYNYDVTPQYLVQNKTLTEQAMSPNPILKDRKKGTESYHRYMKMKAIDDFKSSTCQVFESSYDQSVIDTRPGKPYEMMDGFNNLFGNERYKYPELLFQPNLDAKTKHLKGIHQLISESIVSCDVDIKTHMLSNIILVGGSSLCQGFNDRLNYELTNKFYGHRVKIHQSNPQERIYSAWQGGSILSSLGTFHQLWLSKQEYDEAGQGIIEKKFS